MREIKFRLRGRHNKIVGYEKWYPGSFNSDHQYWVASPCWLYSEDGQHWNPTPIPHSQKDLYTGLKDKDGKEIYEGDVVQFISYYLGDHKMEGGVAPVEWDDGGWSVDDEFQLDSVSIYNNQIEISGNIYENPKLGDK